MLDCRQDRVANRRQSWHPIHAVGRRRHRWASPACWGRMEQCWRWRCRWGQWSGRGRHSDHPCRDAGRRPRCHYGRRRRLRLPTSGRPPRRSRRRRHQVPRRPRRQNCSQRKRKDERMCSAERCYAVVASAVRCTLYWTACSRSHGAHRSRLSIFSRDQFNTTNTTSGSRPYLYLCLFFGEDDVVVGWLQTPPCAETAIRVQYATLYNNGKVMKFFSCGFWKRREINEAESLRRFKRHNGENPLCKGGETGAPADSGFAFDDNLAFALFDMRSKSNG